MKVRITIEYHTDDTLEQEQNAWRNGDVNINDVETLAQSDPEVFSIKWESWS